MKCWPVLYGTLRVPAFHTSSHRTQGAPYALYEIPASWSTVRAPVAGGSALGAWVGAALGDEVGSGQAGASGGRTSVGADSLLRKTPVSPENARTRMTVRPIATIPPAMPAKIC